MVEVTPDTEAPVFLYFSNDAATKLELVSPSNPLPVSASITPSGTQDVNIKQIGGTTVLTGSGATGAGSERVTVAVDSATVAGSASLPSGTNVIGHVITDSGSTTVATQTTASNLNATVVGTGTFAVQNTAATPAGTNVIGHVISDSGSTTAVTGNVTVVQPTGTNLHAVLDSTSTTAVTQATAANLNATIVGLGTSTTASGGSLSTNVDSVVDGTTTTASVTSATTVLTFANTAGYGYISFGFTSVGSGNTIVVDGASDGSNYNQTPLQFYRDDGGFGGSAIPIVAATYTVPVTAQSIRIRVSVYGSGTVTAYGTLKRGTPVSPVTLSVNSANALSVSGNIASGSADSGNPVKIGSKVNTAVQAFSNGQRADLQGTVTGAILTEEAGRSFNHISTAATTTVKSGAGFLHSITVNALGTVASSATIYDNTAGSGTVIAIINTLNLSGTFTYDIAFSTGLTIVTTGTVAPDITVSYR